MNRPTSGLAPLLLVGASILAVTHWDAAARAGVPSAQPENPPPPKTPPPKDEPKSDPPVDPPKDDPDKPSDRGGSEVVIYLVGGNRVSGILVSERPDALVVRIAGIETTFKSDLIERYEVLKPILERYREMRASIGDDPDNIAILAEWLRSREQLDLALEEVSRLLRLEPNHVEGRRLKILIESQIALRNKPKSPAGPLPARPDPDAKRDADPHFPLLTDAQINTLKVFEIDLDDPPRVSIKRDTITKLIQQHGDSPHMPTTQEGRDALYRQTPTAILDLMFRVRARDLYSEVQVADQPRSMRAFRDDVHAAWLTNACATTQCHGGQEAGRLALYPYRPRSDATVYTNFLILDRFRLDDGSALINYDDPARSPLLQIAVNRKHSTFPHPEAPRGQSGRDGFKPVFDDARDPGFRKAVNWIKSMYRPHPDYPIEYQPPAPSLAPSKEKQPGPPR
ncbi:MAG: hypothetical protein AB7G11_11875 [Phycisphaerales bacterium]